jgi:hypothetical protein
MSFVSALVTTPPPFPQFHDHIQAIYVVALITATVICATGLAVMIGSAFLKSGLGVLAGAAVIVVGAIAAVGFTWPGGHEYNYWNVRQGTVVQIASRFLGSGNSTTQNYPVLLRLPDGSEGTFRCDDSRCANVHAGDKLALQCYKDFQFSVPKSAQGWVCQFLAWTPVSPVK